MSKENHRWDVVTCARCPLPFKRWQARAGRKLQVLCHDCRLVLTEEERKVWAA